MEPAKVTDASTNMRLPDFILGGAMKAGTSQLHALLRHHEDVFIPKLRETQFFCLDDFEENPGFFGDGSTWIFRDYESDYETYLAWYSQFFRPAASHQIIGEDATHYLSSRKAPGRIAEVLPDVKLIFSLRDPVVRTYSHYWHDLAAGRATRGFEEELRFNSRQLIKRSLYKRQVERYLEHFSRNQIKFVIFEDYIRNTQQCVNDLWSFLGLSEGPDISGAERNRNASWYPRFPSLLAWQNGLFRSMYSTGHKTHFTHSERDRGLDFRSRLLGRLDHHLRYSNLRPSSRPAMDPEIENFLKRFFARENQGLSNLIGTDVSTHWPYMKG